jgi:hypothetical protein
VGTDTFVIRDGLIQAHTFYAHTPSPADGDSSSDQHSDRGHQQPVLGQPVAAKAA